METTQCPFCKENIVHGAIKCKHCGSNLADLKSNFVQEVGQPADGTLWLPVPSLILSLLAFLTLFDDSEWDTDTILGVAMFAVVGLVLGVVGANQQSLGKGMSIAGVVLSSLALIGLVGVIVE